MVSGRHNVLIFLRIHSTFRFTIATGGSIKKSAAPDFIPLYPSGTLQGPAVHTSY